ncbi:MAG: DUF2254 domain-containing protein [Actinomycetes bacterium]
MSTRLRQVRDRLRGSLYAVPGVCVVLAMALALGLVAADRALEDDVRFTFGAGADGAREVLSAITTAMITFTGLVFTITIVVLQLTSSQFSPRVLRTFLRDRLTQWALGVFTATFVYAVMVLRTVRSGGDGDDGFVPGLSTTVALVLLLGSVALFVGYIHHVATAIQVSSIIAAIGDETREAIDRRYPASDGTPVDATVLPPSDLPQAVVPSRRSGVLRSIDDQRLVDVASRADVVLRSHTRVGDYLPEGAPLFEVLGDPTGLDLEAVTSSVEQGRERSLQQDVGFGIRQLVDIAERALSPSTNDPTTAVQVLDQLHDLLRRLATRPLRTGVHLDENGAVRLVLPPERFEDHMALALEEIRQFGADHRPVRERVEALLDDVEAAALPAHRDAVRRCR